MTGPQPGENPTVPILEFDPDTAALIEPGHVAAPLEGLPRAAVICFFADVVDEVCGAGRADVAAEMGWELPHHPLYVLDAGEERRVAVFCPGTGAPLATMYFEDAIAHGCRNFVACGGAGALVPGLALGHVVVPDAAVRDEGTSFHYMAAGREVAADPGAVAVAVSVLERHDVPHTVGKTWSTTPPTARRSAGSSGAAPRGASRLRWRPPRSWPSPRTAACGSPSTSTRATTSRARPGTTGPGRPPQRVGRCSTSPSRRASSSEPAQPAQPAATGRTAAMSSSMVIFSDTSRPPVSSGMFQPSPQSRLFTTTVPSKPMRN